jgi:hypothetical protein
VALDQNGNAVVVWQLIDGAHERIQVRTLSAAGVRGSTQTLSASGGEAVNPQLAVDPSGNAVVAWEWADGTNHTVQTRARTAGGTLSATKTLSAAGQYAWYERVAVDPSGNAIFVWQSSDGIKTRSRSAAGAYGSTQTIADSRSVQPYVGVDLAGDAVFMWQRWDGIESVVQTRSRTAAGVLSATQTLATGTGTAGASRSQLAVDPQGNAVFVWENRVGNAFCCMSILARMRLADGTLGATQAVSVTNRDAEEPGVAVDPNGQAFVVWYEGTNAGTPDAKIHAAVGSY